MDRRDRGVDYQDVVVRLFYVIEPIAEAGFAQVLKRCIASLVTVEDWRIRPAAPERRTQKMPLRTRRSSKRGTPHGLYGKMRLDRVLLEIAEFVAFDRRTPLFDI